MSVSLAVMVVLFTVGTIILIARLIFWLECKRYPLITVPTTLSNQQFRTLRQQSQQRIAAMIKNIEEPVELEETWSPEKIEAWRVISVTVVEGDDGLWLGFSHPDGPTEDVITPIRHPIGVELYAECKTDLGARNRLLPDCHTIPGEWCASGYGAGCGFYAYKTRQQAIEHLKAELVFHVNSKHTIAKVLLSGKVIEHENGYRAEVLEVVSVEPVSYHGPLLSVIGATTRAFNAFTNIASGGV